jgi:hypothetical protein
MGMCPDSDQEVPLNRSMTRAEFEARSDIPITETCAACAPQGHTWDREEQFLGEPFSEE